MKSQENRELRDRDNNLASVLSSPEGRAFVYDLVYRRAGLETIAPEGLDRAVYEGRRSVGVTLMLELQDVHAGKLLQMLQEGITANHKSRTAYAAAQDTDGDDDE
jgi:hypothetical protein